MLDLYPKGSQFELIAYSSSDYPECKVDRKTNLELVNRKLLCSTIMDEGNFERSWNQVYTCTITM